MSATRSQSRRLERKARRHAGWRDAFVAAAREVLAERGFEGFTMSAVAAAADASKPALYYYFESKHELAAALVQTLFLAEVGRLAAAVAKAETGTDALVALVRAKVAHYREDPLAFSMLYEWLPPLVADRAVLEAATSPVSAELNDRLEAKLRADRDAGRLHPDAGPRRLAHLAWFAAHGLVSVTSTLRQAHENARFGLDELSEELCETLRRAARPA